MPEHREMKESYIEGRCRAMAWKRCVLLLKINRMTGWPDRVMISAKAGPVFVEMKTPTGRLSPAQVVVHRNLREEGFQVEIIRSTKEFKTLLDKVAPAD